MNVSASVRDAKPYDLVVLGLSLSSSWGNGHATTYRSLLRGLHRLGRRVLFLERDAPWYRSHRDLPQADFCDLVFYGRIEELIEHFAGSIADARAVMIGSYVPDGIAVIDAVRKLARGPVMFYDIDTPITLARLRQGEEDYLAARQIPLLDTYFSFSGGPTLHRLEDEFGARRALSLYCSVQDDRYRPTDEPFAWDLGYLGTYSPDRQPMLERLLLEPARRLPSLRFVVAGPCYPETVAWPDNVERIEHLPPDRHASFYSRQRYTLNITRADMAAAGWSPSVRLFEAAACGTPVISDWWPGLGELFPLDETILPAGSAEDVVRILTGIGAQLRFSIAAKARARVLRSHTGLARARELVASVPNLRQEPAPT
ncbi:CgeB family protein [Marinivivus vitaminiproducens]|uniref:CgeB family protein n=1 Tax=Marinivivus vitaminiproducens TaxID=3035935 RepID=UPI00279D4C83|nr:glycosyltransferase [Geminicoccaceae bacterium SCSIO 64248]